jgi:putative lipoic acid-binding regulatory protein
MTEETLLEFPCRFPIKIMVRSDVEAQPLVMEVVAPHTESLSADDIVVRSSKEGKFLAITVHVEATSKAQLDTIYQALTDHEHVLMSL